MSDVIITGLPRSGATVVSALLDQLPDAVALNMLAGHIAQLVKIRESLRYCKWLTGDFIYRRAQLLRHEPIRDWRAPDGAPLLDGMRDARQQKDEKGIAIPVRFIRPGLSKDFVLAAKHTLVYTGILPTLAEFEHFRILAVIRNPLDVLASWRSLSGNPLAQGKTDLPASLWPEAVALAENKMDIDERMVHLYELHLQRYHELRKRIDIVKYEDVTQDPMVVSRLFKYKKPSAAAGQVVPPRRVRINRDDDRLRELFRQYGVFTRQYYPDL